jgi:hypothetical protein
MFWKEIVKVQRNGGIVDLLTVQKPQTIITVFAIYLIQIQTFTYVLTNSLFRYRKVLRYFMFV